jgi:UDP-N-acetylmuramoylalanine--D-glutamate ligase
MADASLLDQHPPELQGRAVTVIGGARSGLAAAELVARHGAVPFLTDAAALSDEAKARMDAAGIAHESGGHTERARQADLAVVSPGVPTEAPLVQLFLKAGVPVVSEVEAASWFARGPVVAITGSNGKTTTTTLLAHLCAADAAAGGPPAEAAGNIGTAFSDLADRAADGTRFVLEVSSFQLDHVRAFRPRVAVLLNITPDHLDRYGGSFARYADAKHRIYENQQPGDALVYNADDPEVAERCAAFCAERGVTALPFSVEREVEQGGFVRDGQLVLRLPGGLGDTEREEGTAPDRITEHTLMQQENLALRGTHNLYNSLAAALAARALEIRSEIVRDSLAAFEGVEHRLERVAEIDGVAYVNDSKATNVNAVWYALGSFDRPVVLIAGGRDKGNDYGPLLPLLREGARAVVAVGESGPKVIRELGDAVPEAVLTQTMAEAVDAARRLAQPGDVVLLSPACSSFDQYANYERRGEHFKKLVAELRG